MKSNLFFVMMATLLFLILFGFVASTLLTVSSVEPILSVVAEEMEFKSLTPYMYIRRATLVVSGGYVTGVEVSVFNNNPRDITTTFCVTLYSTDGSVVGSGCVSFYVRRKSLAVATIPIPQYPRLEFVKRVVVYEGI